jgi:hypothetical protein
MCRQHVQLHDRKQQQVGLVQQHRGESATSPNPPMMPSAVASKNNCQQHLFQRQQYDF